MTPAVFLAFVNNKSVIRTEARSVPLILRPFTIHAQIVIRHFTHPAFVLVSGFSCTSFHDPGKAVGSQPPTVSDRSRLSFRPPRTDTVRIDHGIHRIRLSRIPYMDRSSTGTRLSESIHICRQFIQYLIIRTGIIPLRKVCGRYLFDRQSVPLFPCPDSRLPVLHRLISDPPSF